MKRNSARYNGVLSKYLKELFKKSDNSQLFASLAIRGHVKVHEVDRWGGQKLVFDQSNLIVDEGKGLVTDFLAQLGFTPGYVISPFESIILTKNTSTEQAADTFINSVYDAGGTDYISDEGCLHIPTWTTVIHTVTHTVGSLSILLNGTITQQYGNDVANNHINSVALVAGSNKTVGGPGEAAYTATNNERLFARVNVGDLVKTSEKSFSFSWYIEIQ